MTDEIIKYYELLGVAPGASIQELKAAHRDLAKVWHPDRFSHDPRLQQKAQEKLKEINEAFDQLKSGKAGRRAPAPSHRTNQSSTPPETSVRRTGSNWKFILLPALVFVLIFFAAFRALIPTSQQRAESQTAPIEQALPNEELQTDNSQRLPANELPRGKRSEQQPSREATTNDAPVIVEEARQVRPLPTVTITIDPMSGLLATTDCPVKNRMTYPSGAEPRAYCNLSHKSAAPAQADSTRQKESRLKSFAKRLSPTKLFGSKESSNDGSSKQEGKTP